MKKIGFTLAEVLVTLGIIGVVAALTMPQFTANTRNQSNASKLSTIVSDYENVFGLMLLQENCTKMEDTEFGAATTNSARSTALNKYTKFIAIKQNPTELGYSSPMSAMLFPLTSPALAATDPNDEPEDYSLTTFYPKNLRKDGNNAIRIDFGISLTNGAIIMAAPKPDGSRDEVWRELVIDVNGTTSPNTLGRDVFAFVLTQEGHMFPYGSLEAKKLLQVSKYWKNSDVTYGCTGSTKYTGLGCAGRLVEHNYKVDY